jgi:tight adherence protein C
VKYLIYVSAGLAPFLFVLGTFLIADWLRNNLSISSSASVPSTPTSWPVAGSIVVFFAYLNETPALQEYCASIQEKLKLAGRPAGGMSAPQFLGVVELTFVASFIVILLFSTLSGSLSIGTLIIGLLFASVLSFVCIMWLDSLVADRRKAISRQFPYFMDLAVMSMEAGAGFLETLEIFVRDNEGNALADEFHQVVSEVRMGKTLTESLQALVDRSSSALVQNALLSVIQGERMGTPIAQVLAEQAETIRFERSQMAERLAEEVKLKMQGPAMMMLVAILLLVLGPAVIDMAESNIF